jgi:peroxiredoxin
VTAQIGSKVGERAPDFELTLVDGSTVTLASLIENDRPAFLFFFATF